MNRSAECCFAVVPDGSSEPAAVFADLGDALEWALASLGSDRFVVRHIAFLVTPPPPGHGMMN